MIITFAQHYYSGLLVRVWRGGACFMHDKKRVETSPEPIEKLVKNKTLYIYEN